MFSINSGKRKKKFGVCWLLNERLGFIIFKVNFISKGIGKKHTIYYNNECIVYLYVGTFTYLNLMGFSIFNLKQYNFTQCVVNQHYIGTSRR